LLGNLKVLEAAISIKGAYCGWLFAQAGASVHFTEYSCDSFGPEVARWLSMEKTPLKGQPPRADEYDVVILDGVPELAAGVERTSADANRPVVIGLSDVPGDGPTSDLTVSALSGMMAINASETSPPLREPGNQTYMVAALSGFFGGCAALVARERGQGGSAVRVSALEAMVNVLAPQVLAYGYQGVKALRSDDARGYLFPCSDGWVSIVIASESAWTTVAQVWGIPGWEQDERLNSEKNRRRNMDAVRDVLRPYLESRKCREVFEELAPMRVVCGYAATPAMLLTDPHLTERESFIAIDGARPKTIVPRLPIRVIETRQAQRGEV